MSLHDIAPRLARALDQMNEVERVLGWMRDCGWTGGFYVLVSVKHWLPNRDLEWIYVDRVTSDAAPYPIKGVTVGNARVAGQWSFWEVAGIRFLTDDFPELFEMHPDLPRPPLHQPWGETLEEINQAIRPGPIRGLIHHETFRDHSPVDHVDPVPGPDINDAVKHAIDWWRRAQ